MFTNRRWTGVPCWTPERTRSRPSPFLIPPPSRQDQVAAGLLSFPHHLQRPQKLSKDILAMDTQCDTTKYVNHFRTVKALEVYVVPLNFSAFRCALLWAASVQARFGSQLRAKNFSKREKILSLEQPSHQVSGSPSLLLCCHQMLAWH